MATDRGKCGCLTCQLRKALKKEKTMKTEYRLVSVKCESDVDKVNAMFDQGWVPLRMDEVSGVGLYMLNRTTGVDEVVENMKNSLEKFGAIASMMGASR